MRRWSAGSARVAAIEEHRVTRCGSMRVELPTAFAPLNGPETKAAFAYLHRHIGGVDHNKGFPSAP
jgi:hypothetical protein